MRVAELAAAVLVAILALSLPALACDPIADALASKTAALQASNAGRLVVVGPNGRSYVLDAGCYELDASWKKRRLTFLVNNHVDPAERREKEFDLGVQILKLAARPPDAEPNHSVTAFRSQSGVWYRGLSQAGMYRNNSKKLDLTPNQWTEEHDAGGMRRNARIDIVLGGPFHAQARPDSKSTFAPWWRLDSRISDRYDVNLNNLLFKFETPGSQIAGGVPFNTTARGFEAIIIRYNSFSSSIGGDVRLCFSDCATFERMRVESLTRGRLDALFRVFFPLFGDVSPRVLPIESGATV